MALMLGRLNAALISAGAPEDKAREAAEEVAGFEIAIRQIKSTQRLHTWMLTTLMICAFAFILRILFVLVR